jgi:hypothetical protein
LEADPDDGVMAIAPAGDLVGPGVELVVTPPAEARRVEARMTSIESPMAVAAAHHNRVPVAARSHRGRIENCPCLIALLQVPGAIPRHRHLRIHL